MSASRDRMLYWRPCGTCSNGEVRVNGRISRTQHDGGPEQPHQMVRQNGSGIIEDVSGTHWRRNGQGARNDQIQTKLVALVVGALLRPRSDTLELATLPVPRVVRPACLGDSLSIPRLISGWNQFSWELVALSAGSSGRCGFPSSMFWRRT